MNYVRYDHFMGEKTIIESHTNQQGVTGGIINALRYIIQSNDFFSYIIGFDINHWWHNLLGKYASWGTKDGWMLPIKIFPDEDFSWYGPLTLFIIVPGIVYNLFKGNSIARLMLVSIFFFAGALSYTVAWNPHTNRFFSLFFASSALIMAPVLRYIVKINTLRRFLLFVLFCQMSFAALMNTHKPFFYSGEVIRKIAKISKRPSIQKYLERHLKRKEWYPELASPFFAWTCFIGARDVWSGHNIPHVILQQIYRSIPKNSRVLMVVGSEMWTYQLLQDRRDLKITLSRDRTVWINGSRYDINEKEGLPHIQSMYDYILFYGMEPPQRLIEDWGDKLIRYVDQNGLSQSNFSLLTLSVRT